MTYKKVLRVNNSTKMVSVDMEFTDNPSDALDVSDLDKTELKEIVTNVNYLFSESAYFEIVPIMFKKEEIE